MPTKNQKPKQLKPLDSVRVNGADGYVLEVKNNKVTIQFDDGSKHVISLDEAMRQRLSRGWSAHGRPPKADKHKFGQITCVLRLDTIQLLRDGANSKHFGDFLQAHLDKHPVPTRAEYLAMTQGQPLYTTFKRKRVPVIMASGTSRSARKLAKEEARRARLTPEERAWEDQIREGVMKVLAHDN